MGIIARQSDFDHIKWLEEISLDWSDKVAVDLGCGSGFLAEYLLERGAQKVLGIDLVQPEGMEENHKLCFKTLDLESSTWPVEAMKALHYKAQVVLAFDILEHLSSPYQFLKDCHSLLETGGRLVLTTPNVNSWERILRPGNWSGARDEQHKVLFTKYSLGFLAEKAGFDFVKISAPVRAAGALARSLPDIGGQLLLTCQKA